ncbi:hypothetical protein [Culicoidibacter larvae]|uniref:Phage tail protein n=1 Tax=Culicoidibacter larvae TaxID=2579976 RepID=A0A5R8QDA6_9FIRM|nr:hypothetical protein [Culicoidibacter larvae]TLG75245.1 hypothetical protein FEZ08_04155 [Culicoidibacter larvae]
MEIKFAEKELSKVSKAIFIQDIAIGYPEKRKIKAEIPYMNGTYDFTYANEAKNYYGERAIEVQLLLAAKSREQAFILHQKVMDFFTSIGKQKLEFSDIIGWYYMAELEATPVFEEVFGGYFSVKLQLTAYPFRIKGYFSKQLWDTFCFETDWLQNLEFTVAGSAAETVFLHNVSVLTITATSAMTMVVNGKATSLKVGKFDYYGLELLEGANEVTFAGTGNVQIEFVMERL